MRNECGIVRDLLPLYIEGMVCGDTVSFVEEHLAVCTGCRAELERISSPSGLEQACQTAMADPPEEGDQPLRAVMRRWERRLRLLYRTISALMMLLALLAFAGMLTGTGGGFLDLSNIVGAVLGGLTVICAGISAAAWRTDRPRGKAKVLFVAVVALVVAAAVLLRWSWRVPATEFIG